MMILTLGIADSPRLRGKRRVDRQSINVADAWDTFDNDSVAGAHGLEEPPSRLQPRQLQLDKLTNVMILAFKTESILGQPTISAPAARCSVFSVLITSLGSRSARFSIQCKGTETPCQ